MKKDVFRFRKFEVNQTGVPAKIGTDGMLLGAWASGLAPKRILDIGTGTGLVALMLAQRFPDAEIDAVENHSLAAGNASRNFAASPWSDRLRLHESDFLHWADEAAPPYDLIVSNPPFFENAQKSPDPDRNSWRQSGSLTLSSLFKSAAPLLAERGHFVLVLPAASYDKAFEYGIEQRWCLQRVLRIRMKPEKPLTRVLMQWGNAKQRFQDQELTVQTGGSNEYSSEYVRLTSDFYPWM